MKLRLLEVQSTGRAEIDVENRLIKNVAVLGRVSQNQLNGRPRRYTDAAFNDAVRLFENSKVFMGHRPILGPLGARRGSHPPQNYVGRLKGMFIEGDLVRARELHVINESVFPLLSSTALHDPEALGLSIDADGDVNNRNDVTSIGHINSVDIVSDPATVRGLFEEVGKMDNEVTPEQVIKELQLDQLKKGRPDLVQQLTESQTAKITELEKQLTQLTEEKNATSKRAALVEKASKAGVQLTDVRLKALTALTEDKDVDALIEDWKTGTTTRSSTESRAKSSRVDTGQASADETKSKVLAAAKK